MSIPTDYHQIKPEHVLNLTQPTDRYLCPLSANKYNINFYSFTIRNLENNHVAFHVERDPAEEIPQIPDSIPPELENALRTIRYDFPPSFLSLKHVGAKLVYGVGDKPVPNFRMIERHYFRGTLVKSFDFKFGFCIPNSTNSWEAIYDMPVLSPEWEQAIINGPYETKSDSFYFVGDELVMHNKAEYAYNSNDTI